MDAIRILIVGQGPLPPSIARNEEGGPYPPPDAILLTQPGLDAQWVGDIAAENPQTPILLASSLAEPALNVKHGWFPLPPDEGTSTRRRILTDVPQADFLWSEAPDAEPDPPIATDRWTVSLGRTHGPADLAVDGSLIRIRTAPAGDSTKSMWIVRLDTTAAAPIVVRYSGPADAPVSVDAPAAVAEIPAPMVQPVLAAPAPVMEQVGGSSGLLDRLRSDHPDASAAMQTILQTLREGRSPEVRIHG